MTKYNVMVVAEFTETYTQFVEVEADNEEDAERIALDNFDVDEAVSSDIQLYDKSIGGIERIDD